MTRHQYYYYHSTCCYHSLSAPAVFLFLAIWWHNFLKVFHFFHCVKVHGWSTSSPSIVAASLAWLCLGQSLKMCTGVSSPSPHSHIGESRRRRSNSFAAKSPCPVRYCAVMWSTSNFLVILSATLGITPKEYLPTDASSHSCCHPFNIPR